MNMTLGRRVLLATAAPAMALFVALLVSSAVLIASGSNPLEAFSEMVKNGVKLEVIIDTLNRATPLFLSGIAAAIGFKMNLFNIGVEGQYQLAAFAAAVVGANVVLPGVLHVGLIILVAMVVGALWSGLAGVLKTERGVNEVIGTIMLNYVVTNGIIAALYTHVIDKGNANNAGTPANDESGWLPDLNGVVELFTREIQKGRKLTGMLAIAIVVGIFYHLLVNRSRIGFDLRASGINPVAARAGGVPPKRMVIMSMLIGGVIAGLVGLPEIVGNNHSYDQGFVKGLGFLGIGVALLGRNKPLGIALSALLFAFLDSSAGVLQFSGTASKEIVVIMQATILFAAVIAYEVVNRIRLREEVKSASLTTGATA
ncbi:MAG: ABC transporter permease [Acidimicrobiales bacterium]